MSESEKIQNLALIVFDGAKVNKSDKWDSYTLYRFLPWEVEEIRNALKGAKND